MNDDDDNLDSSFSLESDDDPGPRRSITGWIGILVGIVGIGCGFWGIHLAQSASAELEAFKEEVESQPDRSEEFESNIESIEERLVSLGSELMRINRTSRQMRDNVQEALDGMGSQVSQNRRRINETVEKVQEMVEALESRPEPAPRAAARPEPRERGADAGDEDDGTHDGNGNDGNGDDADTTERSEDGSYAIQSGDTLSSIANRFGITLTQLMNANPGINPRALQIGQRIRIPDVTD